MIKIISKITIFSFLFISLNTLACLESATIDSSDRDVLERLVEVKTTFGLGNCSRFKFSNRFLNCHGRSGFKYARLSFNAEGDKSDLMIYQRAKKRASWTFEQTSQYKSNDVETFYDQKKDEVVWRYESGGDRVVVENHLGLEGDRIIYFYALSINSETGEIERKIACE
ncbi:hypothetical protein HBN50_06740 [Halobacteriovorax sp. GB3]|uniref:hypothetical protein n=1 Tax=Halobacteriovorax sp. GB3 TaxID=2719615 RepID=UPI00235E4D71|nr:hypothetical protein [Halobacteriovorax sp. GB3]MDD0852784.1 hypothetical protein [Halobacteriovorax sp. GB3]